MTKAFHWTVVAAMFCAGAVAMGVPHQKTGGKTMGSVHTPVQTQNVTMKGELGTRYTAATCNLFTRPDRYPVESYVASAKCTPGALWWDWPGDQIGRMFSVMEVAEGYGWAPATSLRREVGDAILPCQTPEGYFGTDPLDRRLVSGNGFALRGLMDAFADTGEKRYLDAARRLGRYLASVVDRWVPTDAGKPGDEFYHPIDGLVRLYEVDGGEWALDAAKKIAAHAGRTAHAHHSLTFYRGVIDLYRLTGDKKLLNSAEDYLKWCKESRLVTGGLPEGMPKSGQDEGCATSDYVVVDLMMFAATGRDEYLDEAEHVLVNHLMMSQFHTGGFGHRTFDQEVLGGKQWQGWDGAFGSENPGCCSLWGQWALGQTGTYLTTLYGKGVDVNLYADADIDLPSLGSRLQMRGDFPRSSYAKITVRCDKASRFALRLRVPSWATGVEVTLGGQAIGVRKGSRVVVDRRWSSGDVVAVEFTGGFRVVAWPGAGQGRFGVFDGPVGYGLFEADGDPVAFRSLVVDASGNLLLSANGKPQAADSAGRRVELKPIYLNWMDPDVKNPRRLRVTFSK